MNNNNGNNGEAILTVGVYTIRDVAADLCDGPIVKHRSEAAVMRDFYRELENERSQLGKYPQDYELVYLGKQNEQSGELLPEPHRVIARGREWANVRDAKTNLIHEA